VPELGSLGISAHMKHPNTKFAVCLATWTAGLVLVFAGGGMLLFVGFGTIIISELFTLRRKGPTASITAGFVPAVTACVAVPYLVGVGEFPLVPLIGFWLLGVAEEVHSWRESQRLMPNKSLQATAAAPASCD
jgi:hypothetical protein